MSLETLLIHGADNEIGVTTSDSSITPENSFTDYLLILRKDPSLFYGAVARGETFEEALQKAKESIGSSVRASMRSGATGWLRLTDFQIRFPNDLPPKSPRLAKYPDNQRNGTVIVDFDRGTETIVPFIEELVNGTS